MFSRSEKKSKKTMVEKKAVVKIVKPEQEPDATPVFDLSSAKISVVKPESGLKIMVEETEGEEDE